MTLVPWGSRNSRIDREGKATRRHLKVECRGEGGRSRSVLFILLLLWVVVSQSSFAENLISRPVGFIRLTIPSNAQVLVSTPFPQSNASGEPVLKWDAVNQKYARTSELFPGSGFWIDNRGCANQDIFLAGEVVLSATHTRILRPACLKDLWVEGKARVGSRGRGITLQSAF